MGATNCPETPRQRMIGMMYLVLTAMLALNVSKEILEAFVTVSDTVERTNKNFEEKIGSTYELFADAAKNTPEKAQVPYEKAEKIREKSNELVAYLKDVKDELFFAVDNIPLEVVKANGLSLKDLSAKDNISKVVRYFFNPNEKKTKGEEMVEKFVEYKNQLVEIVDDTAFTKDNAILASGLQTDSTYKRDNVTLSWIKYNFEGSVAAAAFTLLNKTIGEIRNMEYETVNHLFSSIDAKSYKFSNVEAKVIPNSRIVFSGDRYEADIIVAAFDNRQNPTVYWASGRDAVDENNLSPLQSVEGNEGVVHLQIPTNAVGDQKFAGVIKLKDPSGADIFYHFNSSYMVTKPSAAVAAEKMNVFYAGIPNPVVIAAPVASERLKIDWGGATASSTGGGKYDVSVPSSLVGKEITINVSAEIEKGRPTQKLGSTPFRVKAVPEPNIFVGGNISSGKHAKDAILANAFVSARMGADFNYELKWTILSYKVTFVKNGIEEAPITVNAAPFTDQVRSKIQSASSGTIVEFSEIKIQSIAGQRPISRPIVIRIR